jgi:hypothetical protein
LNDINAILGWPRCAKRDVRYLIDDKDEVAREAFEEWIRESEALGFTEINYSVDHQGGGPVIVSVWASAPAPPTA